MALLCSAGPSDARIIVGFLGLAAIALMFIHRWLAHLEARLTDTSAERLKLNEDAAQCQAAHLANMAVRERLRADAAAAEGHVEQRIAEERATIRREFEETRAIELCESYEQGAVNERNGRHRVGGTITAELIYLADRRPTTSGTSAANGVTRP